MKKVERLAVCKTKNRTLAIAKKGMLPSWLVRDLKFKPSISGPGFSKPSLSYHIPSFLGRATCTIILHLLLCMIRVFVVKKTKWMLLMMGVHEWELWKTKPVHVCENPSQHWSSIVLEQFFFVQTLFELAFVHPPTQSEKLSIQIYRTISAHALLSMAYLSCHWPWAYENK